MTLLAILDVVSFLLQGVAKATPTDLDDEAAKYFAAALENIKKARGRVLTKKALMDWKVEPKW